MSSKRKRGEGQVKVVEREEALWGEEGERGGGGRGDGQEGGGEKEGQRRAEGGEGERGGAVWEKRRRGRGGERGQERERTTGVSQE